MKQAKKTDHKNRLSTGEHLNTIVFCDFDGTVTEQDVFVNVCQQFAGNQVDRYLPEIINQTMTLKDGINKIIESIPSYKYNELLNYAATFRIREGFQDFITFLNTHHVPLVIISGGLVDLIHVHMETHMNHIDAVYAPKLETAQDFLTITSEFSSMTHHMEKTKVMELFRYREAVAIGDGLTDQSMALASDLVFAREGLGNYLKEQQKEFQKWNDFHDIIRFLKTHWEIQ